LQIRLFRLCRLDSGIGVIGDEYRCESPAAGRKRGNRFVRCRHNPAAPVTLSVRATRTGEYLSTTAFHGSTGHHIDPFLA